ncbi:atp-dependent rna helicase chl1 [Neofusicoccum parvum]|nr:atp-dependent rna helicase chl1 [Neofusicoccum parvum]
MAPIEAHPNLPATMQRNFHHPYEPYDIQRHFMSALYECIEDSKVGIFESPTGQVVESHMRLFDMAARSQAPDL